MLKKVIAATAALVVAVISSVLTISPAHAKPSDTSILAPSTVAAGERFVVRAFWMVGTGGKNCLDPAFDFGGASEFSHGSHKIQCEWSSRRPSKRFKKEMVAHEFAYRDPGVYTITVQAGVVNGKTFKPLRLTKDRLRGPRTLTHTITVTDPVLDQSPGLPENWRDEMLDAVNFERELVGAPPVKMCKNLQKAAQRFAKYQATENFYSHEGPDGSTVSSRANAAGYRSWSRLGENIHKGPDSVSEAMAGWVASPGHYSNLVNPALTHVGFGYVVNPDAWMGRLWVQNFGAGGKCNGR